MDNYSLYVFWWGIAGVFFLLELITPATIFIFPAGVALVVSFLSLFVDSILIQGIAFFVLSAATIALIRPMFVNSKKDVGYKNGKASLIGKEVRVVETINNEKEQGRIKHASDSFPARNVDDAIIEEGQRVKIIQIDGITVTVEVIAKNNEKKSL